MDLLAFILALQAEGKTAEEVKSAVDQYLEDNPTALDQAAVEAILDGRLDDIVLAQQAQPVSEDNRIWFPTAEGETVRVPTYEEYSELKSAISVIQHARIGVNLYDEETNGEAQTDPQYTVGTVFLDGYVGDIVISCNALRSGYITDLHVYDSSDNDLGVSLGSNIYNPPHTRSGKKATIPSGAVKMTFKYRTAASSGSLVTKVMVTQGSAVPLTYEAYEEGFVLIDSPYITLADLTKVAYVSTTGNDDNDGLTFATAKATFANAMKMANVIVAERGEYTEILALTDVSNYKFLPYNIGLEYSHQSPTVEKVKLKNGCTITGCSNIYFEDFIFESTAMSSVVVAESTDVEFCSCEANNSTVSMGFDITDSNVTMNNCYATGNHIDGFNFHGYGKSIMNNCVSVSNEDDGCSHHDGCIGLINGGEFTGNGKAGIAPAYGAHVNINNALCKNNTVHGIGYLSTDNGHANMTGTINSCAMVGNANGLTVNPLCSVIAINCVYSGNTTDKNVTGTLTEY